MRFLVPLGVAVALVAAFLLLRAGPAAVAVVEKQLVLSFPGATGWREEPACTDVDATDACAGEWTHEGGQKVRVLLLPLIDAARLGTLTQRLQQQVEAKGGVVGELDLQGNKVVRMLQPVVRAEDNVDVVNITYLLPSPDRRLLHLVTSLVLQKEQIEADQRVRDLLAFSAWTEDADL
ncbi:MAG: hypothetical protein Q8O67_25230 [Deltaproteobacteria bacterium]|nr:hypothetical protein [Deltaproteobacteria bacterium]